MNFNKCERCGCFFMPGSNICPKCEPKDINEMGRLKNFLDDSPNVDSIQVISEQTGITAKNINRFLGTESFSAFSGKFQNDLNININL